MYEESDLLPISALQHLVFCERQWGLIHLEQAWAENQLTTEGRLMHDRAHREEHDFRDGQLIVRGLRIHSLRLGLAGVADVVEFNPVAETGDPPDSSQAIRIPHAPGWWRPMPVEYKRGKPKYDRCDEIQLCAQALCLEEMLCTGVAAGALFYGQPRRRTEVVFDSALREETEHWASYLHELSGLGKTPPPVYGKKCRSCSLLEACQPKATDRFSAGSRYVETTLQELGLGPMSRGHAG